MISKEELAQWHSLIDEAKETATLAQLAAKKAELFEIGLRRKYGLPLGEGLNPVTGERVAQDGTGGTASQIIQQARAEVAAVRAEAERQISALQARVKQLESTRP